MVAGAVTGARPPGGRAGRIRRRVAVQERRPVKTTAWATGDRPADLDVDSHRRLRGPYTGLGAVLRELVPTVHRQDPDLVRRHNIELLTIAPDLHPYAGTTVETLTSSAVPDERTRLYATSRTRQHAHGAVEFLLAHIARQRLPGLCLSFRDVDEADHTDQEFLAIALRRARGRTLTFTVSTRGGELIDELVDALRRYARPVPASPRPDVPGGGVDPVRAYIDSDGTSTDPALRAAYEQADPARRADLHDQRAAELAARDEWSWQLGAVPYHLEHGSEPGAAGGPALLKAADHCLYLGFYHIVIDYAARVRAVVDPDTDRERYWTATMKMATALAVTGCGEQAVSAHVELRSRYTVPMIHMRCCYALAMLYTRYHSPQHKDYQLAKAYVNTAIVVASLLPDPEQRAFHTAFQQNALALVEIRLGNLEPALELVTSGLQQLDRDLPPDKHRLHRSVLMNNRARVLTLLGRLTEALAAFDLVISLDPNYAEYYVDRADVRRKLGDPRGAIADYDTAIPLSPPFYQLYYNRGVLRADIGDLDGALADLGHVVDLEPARIEGWITLVGLLVEADAWERADEVLGEALRWHTGDARLLHARGMVAAERGQHGAAMRDYTAAVAADPALTAALMSRATLHHDAGDLDAALADLATAVSIDAGDPDLLYNLGYVHQRAGRWAEAVDSYTRAMGLPGADEDELRRLVELCRQRQSEPAAAV